MKIKLIKGLKQIQKKYDTFFIDLWGVVHNGIEVYPEAIDVLQNLNKLNKRFVLISNAPRPSKSVEKYLIKLKMDKKLLKNLITSGEAALQTLKKNVYGKKFYHLGPERDIDLIKGFEENQTRIENCDFILCTGLFENQMSNLEYYKNLLKNFTKKKLVCTNPDLIVHRGKIQEYCAGKIAEIFENLGGKVIYFGKPYREVYLSCLDMNKRILVIGDNLNTDIKGANNMKLDSLFITSGIHKSKIKNDKDIEKLLNKHEVSINYFQNDLTW